MDADSPQRQQTSRSAPQNRPRTSGRAFSSPNWRVKTERCPNEAQETAESPSPQTFTSRAAFSRPGPHVPQAISDGRRLYVGNMPYAAKSGDVQELFLGAGFPIERIDIAIDPFTGRNPSYCFVDLESKELADHAMTELDGREMLGRPVKIKPGVAKNSVERIQQRMEGLSHRDKMRPGDGDRWRRNDTPNFGKTYSDSSRRLYVGGLPKLAEQGDIHDGIKQFFQGYNVESISKQFPPHPAKRFLPGDHYYLFVDLVSIEEVRLAMDALNGQKGPWGANLRVQRARRGMPAKQEDYGQSESSEGEEIATAEENV